MRKERFTITVRMIRATNPLLPLRHPSPLATPEAPNQSWPVDFMHDALICGRRFRTLNVVDGFNREALSLKSV